MKPYELQIFEDALKDIQNAAKWYNEQSQGLGTKFQKQVVIQINKLKSDATMYNIRYKNVRCMIIKKFPFMVHFTIDQDHRTVKIYAIIHTSRNPDIFINRNT